MYRIIFTRAGYFAAQRRRWYGWKTLYLHSYCYVKTAEEAKEIISIHKHYNLIEKRNRIQEYY